MLLPVTSDNVGTVPGVTRSIAWVIVSAPDAAASLRADLQDRRRHIRQLGIRQAQHAGRGRRFQIDGPSSGQIFECRARRRCEGVIDRHVVGNQ